MADDDKAKSKYFKLVSPSSTEYSNDHQHYKQNIIILEMDFENQIWKSRRIVWNADGFGETSAQNILKQFGVLGVRHVASGACWKD
jgi:hypothetical protein